MFVFSGIPFPFNNNDNNHQAVELVQELGRRATIVTGDSRETTYLFQQLGGFTKRERDLVSEHVHSRLACCNQLFTFLNFNN